MLPRAEILAWRTDHAPWADEDDVEQDLLLTRALCDVVADGYPRAPRLSGRHSAPQAASPSRSAVLRDGYRGGCYRSAQRRATSMSSPRLVAAGGSVQEAAVGVAEAAAGPILVGVSYQVTGTYAMAGVILLMIPIAVGS